MSEADSGQQKPKPKAEAPTSAPVNQKNMTAEDFITKAPLFVVENVDGFYPQPRSVLNVTVTALKRQLGTRSISRRS